MKFVSFSHHGTESWGAVVGDGVIDMGKDGRCRTLTEYLSSPDFGNRTEFIGAKAPDVALSEIRYLPVIPRPEKIILLVRNYLDHHQEVLAAGLQRELTEFPPIFLRVWRSQIGHKQPIIRPKVSHELDWEGELAVIIGKKGRRIPKSDAMDYVAGYSCYNDVSVREWQFHAKQIAAGKNFVGTGSFGPWMVTADEVSDPHNLNLEVRVNGKVMQSSNTKNLIFKIPELINYCSTIFDLMPGDVIVTGTPGGVGWSRKPPVFLAPGDLVDVDIEKVGVLTNPVADE